MKTDSSKLKKNRISILGCGWLGLPLAKTLIYNNHPVKGSTTSTSKLKDLKSVGITPFLIELNENRISNTIEDFLDASDTLIINIPPGLRKHPEKNHVQELKNLIPFVGKSTIKNVLYISSTSVFEDTIPFSMINNASIPNSKSNSSRQLIEIEQLLESNPTFNTTILRFSGLFDQVRHPGKSLSGRKNIPNPDAPINLIHKEDCIGIILKILEKNMWNKVFNASIPEHPTKKRYYTQYCKKNHLELPQFDETSPSKGKLIDSSTLAQLFKYDYQTSL